MNEVVLHAEGLAKSYHDGERELPVLRQVSLTLHRGEAIAILGRSGTGKSTLLHLLGLLDRPDRGKIWIQEYDVSTLHEKQRTRLRGCAIGFVFQSYHLLSDFTALENVEIAGAFGWKGVSRTRARRLLAEVGLADREHHLPSKLSGGEQQRVAIARALMNEPALLLCDEPTGNLDPRTGTEILDLFWKMRKEHNVAMVLVTHDPDVAIRADRVLHLQEGELHEF